MSEWVEGDRRSGLAVQQRTEQLLAAIQPNKQSEFRRLTIANYVIGLIKNCFDAGQVEAFMFGSVPLRTYLPDGDIDISVFNGSSSRGGSGSSGLRDIWANQLLQALEAEQKRPDAPFKIRDLQIIQAEVKLVKCVVADLVVDVSYESLGGLCTVAFLESIDRKVGGAHLFKRSIVLVKAWCYYESRLLGAHHGLISSYALEALVLYVFSLYHKELHTPLEVLCKFLQTFSTFNWDEYCLSLQGPIPLNTFPNPVVDLHGVDVESVLLDPAFLEDVLTKYSVQQAKGASPSPAQFPLKYLNIVDPLLPSNNLGRSVSKASFARIRRAFAHGAHTLGTILQKDFASSIDSFDLFFKNTWQSPMRMAADNQAFMHRLGLGALPYPMALAPAYSISLHNCGPELIGLVQQVQPPAVYQPLQQQQQQPGLRPDMVARSAAHTSQKPQQIQASAPIHPPPNYPHILSDAGRLHQQRQQMLHSQQQQQGLLHLDASSHAASRSQYEMLSHSLQLLHLQQGEPASPGGSLRHAALTGRPPTAPPIVFQQQRRLEQRRSLGGEEQVENSLGRQAISPVSEQSSPWGNGPQSAPLSPSVPRVSGTSLEAHRRTASDAAAAGAQGTMDDRAPHPLGRSDHSAGISAASSNAAQQDADAAHQQHSVRDRPLPQPRHNELVNGVSEGFTATLAKTGCAVVTQHAVQVSQPPLAAGQPGGMRPTKGMRGPLSEEAISAILAGSRQAVTAPNTPTTPATTSAAAASSAAHGPLTGASQPRAPPLPAMQQPVLPGRIGMPGPAIAGFAPHGRLLSALTPYQMQLLATQPHLLQSFVAAQVDAHAGPPLWFAQHPAPAGGPGQDGQQGLDPIHLVAQPAVQQQQQQQQATVVPAAQYPHREQQPASPPLSQSDSGGLASTPSGDIFTGDLQSLSQNLNTARSCQLQEQGTPGSGACAAEDSANVAAAAMPSSHTGSSSAKLEGDEGGSRGEELRNHECEVASSPALHDDPALPATTACAGSLTHPTDNVDTVKASLPAVRTCSPSQAPPIPPAPPHPASPPPAPGFPLGTPRAATIRASPRGSQAVSGPSRSGSQQRRVEISSPARSVASSAAPLAGSTASTPTSHRTGERPAWGRPPSSGNSTPTAAAAVSSSRRSWSDIAASSSSNPAPGTGRSGGQVPAQQKQPISPAQQPQLSPKVRQQPLPTRRGGGDPPLPLQERFLARLGEGKPSSTAGSVGGPGRRGGSSAAGGSSRAPSEVGSDQGGTPMAGGAASGRRGGSSLKGGSSSSQPATWSLAAEEFPSLGGTASPAAVSPARTGPAGPWGAKRE